MPDDFVTHAQFAQLYGSDLASKELVVLREHDGEYFWRKYADGWYRLENADV